MKKLKSLSNREKKLLVDLIAHCKNLQNFPRSTHFFNELFTTCLSLKSKIKFSLVNLLSLKKLILSYQYRFENKGELFEIKFSYQMTSLETDFLYVKINHPKTVNDDKTVFILERKRGYQTNKEMGGEDEISIITKGKLWQLIKNLFKLEACKLYLEVNGNPEKIKY